MPMIDASLRLERGGTRKMVTLSDYLDARAEERAHEDEYTWIKGLRHLPVDGRSFRQRFTVRGDSLWWFTELYLHKERVVLDVFRTIAAVEALKGAESPDRIDVTAGSDAARHVIGHAAAAAKVGHAPQTSGMTWWRRLARLDLQARRLTLSAHVTPNRFGRAAGGDASVRIAAFIHRAFWRTGGDEGSAEAYIGPVLAELERQAGASALRYIGVGPQTNFRERRRWSLSHTAGVVPVERYAPFSRLRDSRTIWRQRYGLYRTLTQSEALRDTAQIHGVDCWPLIREQLAGIAWLQWPWSVRAMDEAGAALDVLRPAAALTYAEAGGWGRALVLEARRRGIASIGLQHGFIYRQWLNYLHEPDEMQPDESTGAFPAPTRTLVFDAYASEHLVRHGRFPTDAIRVTGSPKLDALVSSLRSIPGEAIQTARRAARLGDNETLVLVTTKQREARSVLPALIDAADRLGGMALVIKPHPAETQNVYDDAVVGRAGVRVVPPSAALAPLLAGSRALVTVNSTLALDAAALGIPALVIGLPNNLSPFVDAGALAGARSPAEIGPQLERILYDEGFRLQLERAREAFLDRYAMRSTGVAAVRSAEAILELARR